MDAHKTISFVKSGFRLIGCGLGMGFYLYFITDRATAAVFAFLFIAEIIGIFEEMVV